MKCPAYPFLRHCSPESNHASENASAEGIKIAIELVEQMRSHIQGIYLMPPFNRFDNAAEIIEAVHRLVETSRRHEAGQRI